MMISIFFVFLFQSLSVAQEEIVIIQTISLDKKNFIIHRGQMDGVHLDQKSVFSLKNISFIGIATQVSPMTSLWIMSNKKSRIPFKKNDVVFFSQNTNDLSLRWKQKLPKKKIVQQKKSHIISLSLRLNLSLTLSQSVSNVDPRGEGNRRGLQSEVNVGLAFTPLFEGALGFRIDHEEENQRRPHITLSNRRMYATGEIISYSHIFENKRKKFYIGIGGGIGTSVTTISGVHLRGITYLLPYVRLGMIEKISPYSSMLWEFAFEAINSKERMNDKQLQVSSLLNSKISIGVKF